LVFAEPNVPVQEVKKSGKDLQTLKFIFDFHSLDFDMHKADSDRTKIAHLRIEAFKLKLDMLESGAMTLDF